MTRLRLVKTSFTAGELDPALLGRLDLKAQEDGATRLRNVIVQATGGVARRPGLTFVAPLAASVARLVPFDLPQGLEILAFLPVRVDVIRSDETVEPGPAAPWSEAQLAHIAWVRHGDSLLVCHPDVPPQRLVRTAAGSWQLTPWSFDEVDDGSSTPPSLQPFARFAAAEVALQAVLAGTPASQPISAGSTVTLACLQPLFSAFHVGAIFRLRGREVLVTNVTSPTSAVGLVRQDLLDGRATRQWDEQAFSQARGYPRAVALHQNRLVIGGSRDLPDMIWMSATGRPFDFGFGTGLDDEAVSFRLLADRQHVIQSLVSARRLQVFTSAGEWIVTGFPLTPGNAQVEQHTGIGAYTQRRLPPVEVDGATLFVAGNGRELREFLFADSEQAYQAADIALLARHLLVDPIDLAFDGARRLLLIVRADGRVAAVTLDRNSNVVAWSLLSTAGAARAVLAHGGQVVMVVERAGRLGLERLDPTHGLDAALRRQSGTPATSFPGFDHLNGLSVTGWADGNVIGPLPVIAGTVTTAVPARDVVLGLPFAHEVAAMPPTATTSRGLAGNAAYRPIRATFRVQDTARLAVDTGRGARELIAAGAPGATVTGDVSTRMSGWRRGGTAAPWLVVQDLPLPCTVLSVTTEIKVND